MWKCNVSICDTGCDEFWQKLGKEQGTIAVAREVSALRKELACLFLRTPA